MTPEMLDMWTRMLIAETRVSQLSAELDALQQKYAAAIVAQQISLTAIALLKGRYDGRTSVKT